MYVLFISKYEYVNVPILYSTFFCYINFLQVPKYSDIPYFDQGFGEWVCPAGSIIKPGSKVEEEEDLHFVNKTRSPPPISEEEEVVVVVEKRKKPSISVADREGHVFRKEDVQVGTIQLLKF